MFVDLKIGKIKEENTSRCVSTQRNIYRVRSVIGMKTFHNKNTFINVGIFKFTLSFTNR